MTLLIVEEVVVCLITNFTFSQTDTFLAVVKLTGFAASISGVEIVTRLIALFALVQ